MQLTNNTIPRHAPNPAPFQTPLFLLHHINHPHPRKLPLQSLSLAAIPLSLIHHSLSLQANMRMDFIVAALASMAMIAAAPVPEPTTPCDYDLLSQNCQTVSTLLYSSINFLLNSTTLVFRQLQQAVIAEATKVCAHAADNNACMNKEVGDYWAAN